MINLIAEPIPESISKKGHSKYCFAVREFLDMGVESVRIESEESEASGLAQSLKYAIRTCGLEKEVYACIRNGRAYMAKINQE